MSDFHTTDLCDAHEALIAVGALQVADPGLRHFGGLTAFSGVAATLKVHEDNSLVRSQLETPGEGRVLVVDGGGSQRCALLGDQLAALAVRNGWAGVVVWGCVRDSTALKGLNLGVLALATHPLKSVKRGAGAAGETLRFAGVRVSPGAWVYADEDGLLIADTALR